MPKIVDHESRRRELAMVAASLVATRGVGKCTVRNLARAAGFSTGVVSHYFADSSEMLFAAYQTAFRSAARRFRDDLQADNSLEGVSKALQRNLPLSPDAVAEWKVRVAFWGASDFGDSVREFEESASDNFVNLLAQQLDSLQVTRKISRDFNARSIAANLEAMLTGLAIQHLMSPGAHPADSVRRRLQEQLYQGVEYSG